MARIFAYEMMVFANRMCRISGDRTSCLLRSIDVISGVAVSYRRHFSSTILTSIVYTNQSMNYSHESYRNGMTQRYHHQYGTINLTPTTGIKAQFEMQQRQRGFPSFNEEYKRHQSQSFRNYRYRSDRYETQNHRHENRTVNLAQNMEIKEQIQMQRDRRPTELVNHQHENERIDESETSSTKNDHHVQFEVTIDPTKLKSSEPTKSSKPKTIIKEKKELIKSKTVLLTEGDVQRVGGGYIIPDVLGRVTINEDDKARVPSEKTVRFADQNVVVMTKRNVQ